MEIVKLKEGLEQEENIISVGIAANTTYNISANWGRVPVLFDLERFKIGDKLSLQEGKVFVGEGVSLIALSFSASIRTNISTSDMMFTIHKNGISASSTLGEVYEGFNSNSQVLTSPTIYVPVAEGDTIQGGVSLGRVGTLTVNGGALTQVVIRVIK